MLGNLVTLTGLPKATVPRLTTPLVFLEFVRPHTRTRLVTCTDVGVPMRLSASHGLHALHCAGPASQLPLQRIRHELAPKLLEMTGNMRVAMGKPPHTVWLEPQIHRP